MIDVVPIATSLDKYKFSYFLDLNSNKTHYAFKGIIESKKYGNVSVALYFNKEYFDFPEAKVAPESQHLIRPFHSPHIGSGWNICYRDGSAIFDSSNIVYCIDFIVQQISEVLNTFEEDNMSYILEEWKSYWYVSETYYTQTGLSTSYYVLDKKFLIEAKESLDSFVLLRIPFIPAIKNCDWPIENFATFEKWISDEEIANAAKRWIFYCLRFKKKVVSFIIYSEKEKLAFGIKFAFKDPILNTKQHQLRPTTIKNIFCNHKIFRFWVEQVENNKLLRSNIKSDFPDLQSKKIALVGAGTIGSNLANILVRIGAGNNKENHLAIVDNDNYEPENFTRHTLSFSYFGCNKAESLKYDLRNHNNTLNLESFSKTAYEYSFDQYDIVIDATGEETLTEFLNYKIMKMQYSITFVASWVQADGKSVSCLIIPSNNCACYECFKKSGFNPITSFPGNLPRRNSCSDVYVPFPVMLSQYAALLTTRVLLDHLEGQITETMFYNQNIESGKITKFTINKDKDCKICN